MKLINANKVYYDNDFEKWYFADDEDFENAQVVDDSYVKENKQLKEQLAEKDEEIAKLKNFMSKWHFENFESFENHYNYLMSLKNIEQLMVENEAMKETIANLLGQKKTSSKAIRKQVCDEIRNLAHNYFELVICDNCGNPIDNDCYISSSELCEILEKVEKEEE